jgi:pre-rRNA-processing protein TSR3
MIRLRKDWRAESVTVAAFEERDSSRRVLKTRPCTVEKNRMLPIIIIRHFKERLSKCSVQPLENKEGYIFRTYKTGILDLAGLDNLNKYVRLDPEGAILHPEIDSGSGLMLVYATLRYAENIKNLLTNVPARALPRQWKTTYPRRQTGAPDPESGLASIEAIFAAHIILGRDTRGLLDDYYWKNQFIELNKALIPNSDVH